MTTFARVPSSVCVCVWLLFISQDTILHKHGAMFCYVAAGRKPQHLFDLISEVVTDVFLVFPRVKKAHCFVNKVGNELIVFIFPAS